MRNNLSTDGCIVELEDVDESFGRFERLRIDQGNRARTHTQRANSDSFSGEFSGFKTPSNSSVERIQALYAEHYKKSSSTKATSVKPKLKKHDDDVMTGLEISSDEPDEQQPIVKPYTRNQPFQRRDQDQTNAQYRSGDGELEPHQVLMRPAVIRQSGYCYVDEASRPANDSDNNYYDSNNNSNNDNSDYYDYHKRVDNRGGDNNGSNYGNNGNNTGNFANNSSNFSNTFNSNNNPINFGYNESSFGSRKNFVYNHSNKNSNKKDKNSGRKKFDKNRKYMPPLKSDLELFDPNAQIQCGTRFEELFSDQKDSSVVVTGAGENPPRIQSFYDCNFSENMMKNLQLLGIRTPTQIQKFVIPLILYRSKGDLVGHAQTGSGKTAAFLLPIIHKIWQVKRSRHEADQPPALPCHPYAVIIAPTRELAQQLYNDARKFSTKIGVTTHLSIGEMPMCESIDSLKRGCDIFVATIGRTEHYIRDELIHMDNVLFFVMDEVDTLISRCARKYDQVGLIKESIKKQSPTHRTLLFSATLNEESQALIGNFVDEEITYFVNVAINRVVDTVRQIFLDVEKAEKRMALLDLLRSASKKITHPNGDFTFVPPKTIVFVKRKIHSDYLAMFLASNGFNVISINSDRTSRQRIDAIEKFAKGFYNILVATDVASRGMNFPRVEHVINYDMPESDDYLRYIHRLGRTGRVGNEGLSTSFFDVKEDADIVDFCLKSLEMANQNAPQFMLELSKRKNASDYRFQRQAIGQNDFKDSR